jgi:hypothetical protein
VKAWWDDSPIVAATYTMRVAAPVLSLPSGNYSSGTSVTISTPTPGARIYYTLDGSEPNEESAPIESGASLEMTPSTLRAKAWLDGVTSSTVTSAVYTVNLQGAGPAPMFYEHINYEGASFSPEMGACSSDPAWSNRISSMTMPPADIFIVIYADSDCTGPSMTLMHGSVPDFRGLIGPIPYEWNDAISSVRVSTIPIGPPPPPPNNSNTCRPATQLNAATEGTFGADSKIHFAIGIGSLSSEMQLAARDALDMINGFTGTTSIVLDPVTESAGDANILLTSDSQEAGGIASFNPYTDNILVLDTVASLAGSFRVGTANLLGHELLHYLGLDENRNSNDSLMKQCTSLNPATCLGQFMANGGMRQQDAEMIPYCFILANEPHYQAERVEEDPIQIPHPDMPGQSCWTWHSKIKVRVCFSWVCGPWLYEYPLPDVQMCVPGEPLNPLLARRPPPIAPYTPANPAHTPVSLASVPADAACPSADRSISVSQTCGRQ